MISELDFSDAITWSENELFDIVRAGENKEQVEALFGEDEFENLRRLVDNAQSRRRDRGLRVYILPGITGSKLGTKPDRFVKRIRNIIWLNPLRIRKGDLFDLSLADSFRSNIEPYGVILWTYLRLKLSLEGEGYKTEFIPYDWRLSLRDIGKNLLEKFKADSHSEFAVVAHSMGGLAIRAAISQDSGGIRSLKKVITLGTPHFGSFSPVPVFQGSHKLLRLAAELDRKHSAEEISEYVFLTMPGFFELLPSAKKFEDHMYDEKRWPNNNLKPRREMLEEAKKIVSDLNGPDERFRAVIGYGNDTIAKAELSGDSLELYYSTDGDGAVLLDSAETPETRSWYTTVEHGALPNDGDVRKAVCELLANDVTDALPETPPRRSNELTKASRDRQAPAFVRSDEFVDERLLRDLLSEFVSSKTSISTPKASGVNRVDAEHSASFAGTRLQMAGPKDTKLDPPQIELRYVCGDITAISSKVYAIGVFDGVALGGAVMAVDAKMDGILSTKYSRNTINGAQGVTNFIRTAGKEIRAESICLVGLGHPGDLASNISETKLGQSKRTKQPDPIEKAHEGVITAAVSNLVRDLVLEDYEDCAIVLFGTNSGVSVRASFFGIVRGVMHAISTTDGNGKFRRMTICELEPNRYQEMVALAEEAVGEAGPPELIQVRHIPMSKKEFESLKRSRKRPIERANKQSSVVYLFSECFETKSNYTFSYNFLSEGGSATTIADRKEVDKEDLEALLKQFRQGGVISNATELKQLGDGIRERLLPKRIAESLQAYCAQNRLVLTHDLISSRIPWETIRFENGDFPVITSGLTRRHASKNISVGKWQAQYDYSDKLSVLIIEDPTNDLQGAKEESKILKDSLNEFGSDVSVDVLKQQQATKKAILEALGAAKYQIVHYAGHAFYEERSPGEGGLIAAGNQIVNGHDIARLPTLPPIIFLNACQSGRVRKGQSRQEYASNFTRRGDTHDPAFTVQRNVSLSEAVLEGGTSNFIGTYWPVGDMAAKNFSTAFYSEILRGEPVGNALLSGRQAVEKAGSADWADYIHFGDYEFILRI